MNDQIYSPEFIKNIAIACHYALKHKTENSGEQPYIKSWQETEEKDKLLTKETVVNILNNKPEYVHFNKEDSDLLFSLVNLITGKLIIEKKENQPDSAEKTTNLTFGEATVAAKKGKKIARIGWNGSGMYAYLVPAASYPAITEVAKKEFGDFVPYREYWALKTAQNDVATWSPSGSDSLATDWIIIK